MTSQHPIDSNHQRPVEDILSERGATHGSFSSNALISQAIKNAYRISLAWDSLPVEIREMLDANAAKSARILSGQWHFLDHYADIIGYTRLGLNFVQTYKDSKLEPTKASN